MERTCGAARQVCAFFTLIACATATLRAVAQPPTADSPTVTYSYPHAPDEPHWNGAFQDPSQTKLIDGIASGNARHSVTWAATTDERYVDVEIGNALVLDRVVVQSYKHYTGRDFQLDHVRLYLADGTEQKASKLLAEQRGYKLADKQGTRDIVFTMPPKPVRRFRIGLQNDQPVRLGLTEIVAYAKDNPDISLAVLAKFHKTAHVPEGPPPVATPEERDAGYVLFAPNYLRRVFPNSVALPHERVQGVSLAASLGEYEPLTVAVYPLEELAWCRVSVTDLHGPVDASIRRDCIDVRTVRHLRQIPGQKGASFAEQYMLVPELLEASATAQLKAQKTQQWWLTIRVPSDATPGEYMGHILVESAEGPVRRLALRLLVLPFRLELPNDHQFGIYWDPSPPGEDPPSEERIIAQLQDMREHGLNSVALSEPASMSPGDGATYNFDLKVVTRTLELLKQNGLSQPIPWSHTFPPVNTSFGSDEHLRQVKAFVEHAGRRFAALNLPEILWYPRDEAWSDPRKQEARVLYEAIKQVPGARTYGTVRRATAESLDSWLDVRCHTVSLNGGFDAPALHTAAHTADDLFWWYTNACREYPAVVRFKAGFFFWKTRATGQFYWAYHSPQGDPYDDLDGIDWCVAYPGDGRPVPTIEWEALREGIDDFRYVYSLELAIAKARADGSTEAASSADEAGRLLDELRDEIVADLEEYQRRGLNFHTDSIWPAEKYDAWRKRIAQMIVRLKSPVSIPNISPEGRSKP